MPLAPGTQIGPYEVVALVGAGGMGEVYRATDTRLGREVAIKLLVPSGTDGSRARRFAVERRTVGALQHANIVALYDVGNFEERPFLVSEFLQGETLRDRLNRAAMPPGEAVDFTIQLCKGLEAAHDKGIVHRDIKPENLFITRDGVLKILDFGIAKRTEHAGNETAVGRAATATLETDSGTILGTAGYMSPEQVRGHAADGRSDNFSVGAVLYEMLTGGRAFQRESALESAYAILKDEPPDLPTGVQPALARIVERCLKKQPKDRFQTASELAAALDAARAHLGVSGLAAMPSSELQKDDRSWNPGGTARLTASGQALSPAPPIHVDVSRVTRYRGGRFLAVVAALAIAAPGSWFAWAHFKRAETPSRIVMAVLPFEDFSRDATKEYFAEGLTEGVISQLGRLRPERLAVIARTSVTQYRHTKKSVKEIARELGAQYVLECSVLHTDDHLRVNAQLVQASDQTQLWAETYERDVKDVMRLQSDVARDVATQIRIEPSPEQSANLSRARSVNPAAYEAYLRGSHFAGALSAEGVRRAISYFEQAIQLDANYAAAYAGLARATHALPIFTDTRTRDVAPRAKAIALRALELDDGLAEAHLTLAIILLHLDWDWPGAERHFRRALELDPNNADAHRAYGHEYLVSIRRDREAIAELERSVELNPVSVLANYMLGNVYANANQLDRAVRQHKRAIELAPDNPRPHGILAEIYENTGLYQEGLAELEKARVTAESDSPAALAVLGRLLTGAGRAAEGQRVLERAESIARTSGASAAYYAALGRRDEAFAELEKLYAERAIGLVFLRAAAAYAEIRDDSRFADLVRRVGIPEPSPP